MTFKLAINPYFWACVKLSLVGDMGKRIEGTFKAKYRRMAQKEYESILAKMRLPLKPDGALEASDTVEGDDAQPHQEWRITDKELLDLVLLDWDDLLDEDDQKMPYTPDNLERMEQILGVRASLVQTFFEAHAKAPEKNSGTRRGASTV
jgi:hypothetical protein